MVSFEWLPESTILACRICKMGLSSHMSQKMRGKLTLSNRHYHYNCTLGHLTMHTVRDIAEGEELTDGYIWTTCMTRSEREEAPDHWGFKCTCTPCTGPETANSNIRRKRLGVLRQSLLAFEDGNNQNREGHEGDHLESRRPEQTAKIAEEVVRLLLEEGVADTSLQDA